MTHTPGPWHVQEEIHKEGVFVYILDSQGRSIAMMEGGQEHLVEDARLIAAAPDLLEACRQARQLCLENGYGRDYTEPKLRSAIAKAEGKIP